MGWVPGKDDIRRGGLWVTASPSSGSSGWSGPKNFLPSSQGCRQLWLSPALSGSDDSRCWDGPKEQAGPWVQGAAGAEHPHFVSHPPPAGTGSPWVPLPPVPCPDGILSGQSSDPKVLPPRSARGGTLARVSRLRGPAALGRPASLAWPHRLLSAPALALSPHFPFQCRWPRICFSSLRSSIYEV